MQNEHCKCKPQEYPFHCSRHCLWKDPKLHQKCKLKGPFAIQHWNMWEQGRDTKQKCAPADPQLIGMPEDSRVATLDDCGCKRRKEALNERVSGLGDTLETLFKWTGIKRLVNLWTSSSVSGGSPDQ